MMKSIEFHASLCHSKKTTQTNEKKNMLLLSIPSKTHTYGHNQVDIIVNVIY